MKQILFLLAFGVFAASTFPQENSSWGKAVPAGAIKELGTIESGSGYLRVRYWPEHEEAYFQFEETLYGDYGFSLGMREITDVRKAIIKYHSWKSIAIRNRIGTRVDKTIIRLNAIEGWAARNKKSYEIERPIFELVFLYVDWMHHFFFIFRHGDLLREESKHILMLTEDFALDDFEVQQFEEIISQRNIDLSANIENLFQ